MLLDQTRDLALPVEGAEGEAHLLDPLWVAVPVEVEAGAERPPRAGEYDDPARTVRGDPVKFDVQVGDEVHVHGVERLGPGQGQHCDSRHRLTGLYR